MSDTDTSDGDVTVTDEDVLEVFNAIEPPAATTSNIANILGCSIDTARHHLETLSDRGLVKRKKGGSVILWWRPREDVKPPTPVDGPETNALEETEASLN